MFYTPAYKKVIHSSSIEKMSVTKKLNTGHTITLSLHDDKMLRKAFEYMAGFALRNKILVELDMKKLSGKANAIDNSVGSYSDEFVEDKSSIVGNEEIKKSINEIQNKLKEEISILEEKLNATTVIQVISANDIDALCRHHEAILPKKRIDVRAILKYLGPIK